MNLSEALIDPVPSSMWTWIYLAKHTGQLYSKAVLGTGRKKVDAGATFQWHVTFNTWLKAITSLEIHDCLGALLLWVVNWQSIKLDMIDHFDSIGSPFLNAFHKNYLMYIFILPRHLCLHFLNFNFMMKYYGIHKTWITLSLKCGKGVGDWVKGDKASKRETGWEKSLPSSAFTDILPICGMPCQIVGYYYQGRL